MGRRREMHRKPNKQELNKMERIKSLLEGEGSKQNIVTVQPVQHKANLIVQPKQIDEYIEYNGIKQPISSIVVTDHALKRINERCKYTEPVKQIRGLLKKAKCIGNVISEDGNESVLFAHGRTGVYLRTDLTKIVTVVRRDSVGFEPVKLKMEELLAKEIRKLTRQENARIRQLHKYKLEADYEIAGLRIRLDNTKSQAVTNACISRIKAIEMRLEELEKSISEIRTLKRQVANSIIAVC